MKKRSERMVNIREAARMLGVPLSSLRVWVWRGRFQGARKETTPLGDYWLIPESALEGFEKRKPGPKPKAKGNRK
ncbi:MAG TPA: helix-turn-helix domain-containing protein [Blastocatellia bacterium]|nr:helix-turn-helix domain-containing protein [Blastocatellia bacterium]